MDWKKLLVAAVAFTVVSQLVYFFGAFVDMPYYTDPANFSLWSKVMMSDAGPPGPDFYAASIGSTLFVGALYVYAYGMTKAAFKDKSCLKAGAKYGLFIFFLTHVTSFLSMSMLLAVPMGLQFSWLAQGLVASLLGGIAIAKLY